jgi:hypothetical protein
VAWGSVHLSELADIANALALESTEVSGDTTVLEVHDSSERLIEERPDGQDRKVAGFGLVVYQRSCFGSIYSMWNAYSQSMNHRLESQIDFAGADDLGDILNHCVSNLPISKQRREQGQKTYTRIIRLQNRNLHPLILEEPLSLSQVQRSMIRRGVPSKFTQKSAQKIPKSSEKEMKAKGATPPVRQESDLVSRHNGAGGGSDTATISPPTLHITTWGGGERKACSFRSNYADQVRNGVFSASFASWKPPFLPPFLSAPADGQEGEEEVERGFQLTKASTRLLICYFTLTKRHRAHE